MVTRSAPADLLPWALASLPQTPILEGVPSGVDTAFTLIVGDASNRRYFRLEHEGGSYIVAEAPPATEKNEAFVAVRNILAQGGVRVPLIHAVDYQRGYLLLEDLGDSSLLAELSTGTVDDYYQQACRLLGKMAEIDVNNKTLAAYDQSLLTEELGRFSTWFVEALLGYVLDESEREIIACLDTCLVDSALEQPTVLVHRDFHSRNLMLNSSGELVVIDFQDAVVGPVTYDLVSLLRDCYIRWPAPQVQQWALDYHGQMQGAGQLLDVDAAQYLRWFDWMGLQRHIKVLGTFARLYLRDNKAAYLEDLPLVVAYVEEILQRYKDEPALASFYRWFQLRLSPLIAQKPWAGTVQGEKR